MNFKTRQGIVHPIESYEVYSLCINSGKCRVWSGPLGIGLHKLMESVFSRPGLGAITLMPDILFYQFIRIKEYITLALDRMYNLWHF